MSRIKKKLATSQLVLRHYEHLFLFSMSTLHVTVVTVVLIVAKYLSLYLHTFICTHRETYTQAHMYNQHTRGITTAGHRDLDEGRKDFVRDLTHTYTHTKKKLMEKNRSFESDTEISSI